MQCGLGTWNRVAREQVHSFLQVAGRGAVAREPGVCVSQGIYTS